MNLIQNVNEDSEEYKGRVSLDLKDKHDMKLLMSSSRHFIDKRFPLGHLAIYFQYESELGRAWRNI